MCVFFLSACLCLWTGIAQSVLRLDTGWTVGRSNPGGGEIFRTGPDQPWSQPSVLYNGCWVFRGLKRPRGGVDHQPLSSAVVKRRVELYIYSPSEPPWPVLG